MNSTAVLILQIFIYYGCAKETSKATKLIKNNNNWEEAKWGDFDHCNVQTVCADNAEKCGSMVTWKYLEKELETAKSVVIIDNERMLQKSEGHIDLEMEKHNACDITFVKTTDEGCVKFHTPNRCPWSPIVSLPPNCTSKSINISDPGDFPSTCYHGPGWEGRLETIFDDGAFKINWAALVKQPRCVYGVTLVDEQAKLTKFFWTTLSDETLPLEYLDGTCDMTIRLYHVYELGCYTVKTKVRCKNGNTNLRSSFRSRSSIRSSNKTQNDSEAASPSPWAKTIGIICGTILPVAAIVAIVLVVALRKRRRDGDKNPMEEKELNDLYALF